MSKSKIGPIYVFLDFPRRQKDIQYHKKDFANTSSDPNNIAGDLANQLGPDSIAGHLGPHHLAETN